MQFPGLHPDLGGTGGLRGEGSNLCAQVSDSYLKSENQCSRADSTNIDITQTLTAVRVSGHSPLLQHTSCRGVDSPLLPTLIKALVASWIQFPSQLGGQAALNHI